jgi:hypothetical protein
MGLWSMAFLGTRPMTALITGWMTDTIGVRTTMALTGAVILLGAWSTRGARLLARPVATEPTEATGPAEGTEPDGADEGPDVTRKEG